ncbi:hypothetical protein ACFQ2B_33055 [Streptomyces stramineus]
MLIGREDHHGPSQHRPTSRARGSVGPRGHRAGPGRPGTGSHAQARALEPACPPPGGGTCYFEWYDASGNRTVELNPQIGACYNTSSAGAVRGTNKTNRTVHLWPTGNCSGSATALVGSGLSWNDPSHRYYSYRPIR